MPKVRLSGRVVTLIVLLVLAAIPCLGQTDAATISGRVADPTGAVVPGARSFSYKAPNAALFRRQPPTAAGSMFSPLSSPASITLPSTKWIPASGGKQSVGQRKEFLIPQGSLVEWLHLQALKTCAPPNAR